MKIAVVYQGNYPPAKGASGADRRVGNITRGLASAGVDVCMLTPRRGRTEDRVEADGFPVYYFGTNTSQSALRNRLAFWLQVCRFAQAEKIDWLLLYSTLADSILPALYLRARGIHIAAEFCDLRSAGFTPSNGKETLIRFALRLDEYFVPKMTDLNIVISNYLKQLVLQKAPATPVLQLPILVDTDKFVPDPVGATTFRNKWQLGDRPLIVYIGGLWAPEGVRYLVEAFAHLAQEHGDARLVIAGRLEKGPHHDDIESLSHQLGLNERLITTGWIGTEEVIQLLSAATILVLPQSNDLFARAALPTKLSEYSAMGKAIVATRVGDVPLYFTDMENAMLCEPNSAESIAHALRLLLSQPALREQLGAAAKKRAFASFDYRTAGKTIFQMMQQAMPPLAPNKRYHDSTA